MALGDQLTGNGTAGPDELFGGVTGKTTWLTIHIQSGTIHRDLLADITGDQVIIITRLLQIIVGGLGAAIR